MIAQRILPDRGFTPAHGFPSLSPADGTVLRAAAGSVLYLALVALFSLGIATLVRESAAAAGIVLGVCYLSPIMAHVITDPVWHNRVERYTPINAGLAIQATRNLAALPIGPWAGLGVLAAWSAATLLGAGLVLHMRDA